MTEINFGAHDVSSMADLVVELLCRRFPDEYILEELLGRGCSSSEAATLLTEAVATLHLQVPFADFRRRQIRRIFETHRKLAAVDSSPGIERVAAGISRASFRDRFFKQNRPVIIEDALKGWSNTEVWTPDGLKQNFGDRIVEVMTQREHGVPGRTSLPAPVPVHLPLSVYLDAITTSGSRNDTYMVSGNRNLESVLADAKSTLPTFEPLLDPSDLDELRYNLWIGPSGTISPLHTDRANILFVQLFGTKDVKLIHPMDTPWVYAISETQCLVDPCRPDHNRFPLFEKASVLHARLAAGQALFIPVGWWHDIRALTVSISVGFLNFTFPNTFD